MADSGSGAAASHAAAPDRPAQAPAKTRELKVEDALLYLDLVKMEFSDKPHIYNEFLEIMKNFKAQSINTPGVIERVKNLFRGYNKLILGFNTFLPEGEGYKIELTEDEQAAGSSSSGAAGAAGGGDSKMAVDDAGGGAGGGSSKPQQFQQRNAINYVTKIRNRFQHEQATYQAFLKILYKYQQDQKGIKDVLEQVSQLFGDHPDLLDEFAQFLPDGVQEQARERLSRAAKEAEMRKHMQRLQQQHNIHSQLGKRQIRDNKAGAGGGAARKQNMVAQQQAQHAVNRQKVVRRRLNDDNRKDQYNHVSVSAERRFFDQAKDFLSAVSKESWNEFVKLLELFASDSLTKRELYTIVSDLFGTNQDLYDEFTRLMAGRADYEAQGADQWFAIPLSEIDFSQSRKCTPSYRALPKDYPRPLCSERNEEEQKVLNDGWVSIPIGSEESNSFKHMRKNQYEEALFKCEDDRFEIDLIIDSNMCTIRVLEPIAEEIENIKAVEEGGDHNSPRFSFQLEKRNLSTIHLNSITRLYGEHGNEILELLRKNPAGTIPVLLKRLQQKDLEWRKARQDLNRNWKDILERNWEKSFDHRSFYFKQDAAKCYSSKHLLAEIKGAFLEPKDRTEGSMDLSPGVSSSVPASPPSDDPAAAPTWASLLGDMQPQLLLSFSNLHHSAHKDIYKIVCYAVECANISPPEREKMMTLWRDLVRVFFNLPVHYLYGETQRSATTDHAPLDPSESWAVNTKVVTIYGSGVVLGFRPSDSFYSVRLPFGVAHVKANAIIGAEALSATAMSAIGVVQEHGQDKIFSGLTGTKGTTKVMSPSNVFLGPQVCYLFFRLYHTLHARLCSARDLATQQHEAILRARADPLTAADGPLSPSGAPSSSDRITLAAATHPLAHMDAEDEENDVIAGSHKLRPSYQAFLGLVGALVDGSCDSIRYEEGSRSLLGNRSYVVYTLDKLLQHLVSALQKMANDDSVSKLIGIFVYHRSRAGCEQGIDVPLYRAHCAALLGSGEEMFRLQLLTPVRGLPRKGETLLAIQTVASMQEEEAAAQSQEVDMST